MSQSYDKALDKYSHSISLQSDQTANVPEIFYIYAEVFNLKLCQVLCCYLKALRHPLKTVKGQKVKRRDYCPRSRGGFEKE